MYNFVIYKNMIGIKSVIHVASINMVKMIII